MIDSTTVTCPTCFEEFSPTTPDWTEVPCSVDYDCEVCCRPMVIHFWECDGDVWAQASGLGDC